jgi:hypothetical protein
VNPTLDTRAKDGPIRNQLAGAVLCAETAPCLDASFHDKQGLDNQHINGGGGIVRRHPWRTRSRPGCTRASTPHWTRARP